MVRQLSVIALLLLTACDGEPGSTEPVEPTPDPGMSAQALACQSSPLAVDLMDHPLMMELGHQGGAHLGVDLVVQGLPVGSTELLFELFDGPDRVAATHTGLDYDEGCRLGTRLVFDDDSLFWDLVDGTGERPFDVQVTVSGASGEASVHRWTRVVRTDWY